MFKLKGFVVTSTSFLWSSSVFPPYHLPLYSQKEDEEEEGGEEAGIRGKLRPIDRTSRWLCGAPSPHSVCEFVTAWVQVQASSKPCAQGELRSSKMAI